MHKLKRCTPVGNELHIVCVKIFRGLAVCEPLFLDAYERHNVLIKLLHLILDAAVPTVVIGDLGVRMGSILQSGPEYDS